MIIAMLVLAGLGGPVPLSHLTSIESHQCSYAESEACSRSLLAAATGRGLFVENRGQWANGARFMFRGAVDAAFDPAGISLRCGASPGSREEHEAVVRLSFVGSQTAPLIEGRDLLANHTFLIGSSTHWRGDVPSYGSIVYRGPYPGIDLVVRQDSGALAYDLCLEPGADLSEVAIRCAGVEELCIGDDGLLQLETPLGILRQSLLRCWAISASGGRREIPGCFRPIGEDCYGFEVDAPAEAQRIVIDPDLEWSSFLGGSDGFYRLGDIVTSVAVDTTGAAYVAGYTESMDFPTTPGAFDRAYDLRLDAFVAKLSPDGRQLVYSTFLGGNDHDTPTSIGGVRSPSEEGPRRPTSR